MRRAEAHVPACIARRLPTPCAACACTRQGTRGTDWHGSWHAAAGTKREPQEERIALPDPCSPREARPDPPSSRTPSLSLHRPRRQESPRGRGAPLSRRPRLEGAAPARLLAARRDRDLPPTRAVRGRSRTSALLLGASAAPASSACARLGHKRGSGQRPAKSRDFSYENVLIFIGHCSCDCWPNSWPLSCSRFLHAR